MVIISSSVWVFVLFLLILHVSSSQMRVAVVTGANKGIGKAIATQLATSKQFSHVILGCRDAARGQAAVDEISKQSSDCKVSAYPLSIGDDESHASFRKAVQDQFGKVDVLGKLIMEIVNLFEFIFVHSDH